MIKLLPLTVLLVISGSQIIAQSHLKDVQATSVWAPATVKIDGRINEWEDSFQAYNKSTRLYYTLSNNDKYLFLAITSTDAANNNKIVAGGITLTVNTAGKKKDKDAYSLTFPNLSRGGGRGQRGQRGGGRPGGRVQGTEPDTAAIAAGRRQLVASSKEIKVLGFKEITDTLISIYNEYGIKTAIGYDSLGNYSYELAVPLKLLGISPDKVQEIAYNLKVNGLSLTAGAPLRGAGGAGGFGGNGGGFGGGGRAGGRGGNAGGGGGTGRSGGNDFADMTSPTDFWGKYTLARK